VGKTARQPVRFCFFPGSLIFSVFDVSITRENRDGEQPKNPKKTKSSECRAAAAGLTPLRLPRALLRILNPYWVWTCLIWWRCAEGGKEENE